MLQTFPIEYTVHSCSNQTAFSFSIVVSSQQILHSWFSRIYSSTKHTLNVHSFVRYNFNVVFLHQTEVSNALNFLLQYCFQTYTPSAISEFRILKSYNTEAKWPSGLYVIKLKIVFLRQKCSGRPGRCPLCLWIFCLGRLLKRVWTNTTMPLVLQSNAYYAPLQHHFWIWNLGATSASIYQNKLYRECRRCCSWLCRSRVPFFSLKHPTRTESILVLSFH